MNAMLAVILAAVAMSRGIPARVVDTLVIVEGRPGCIVLALDNDPTRPVIRCEGGK